MIACLCLSQVVLECELCTSTFPFLVQLAALSWGITPKPELSKLGHSNNRSHKWTVNLRQYKTQPYERQSFGSSYCLMALTSPSFFFLSLRSCLSPSLSLLLCFLSSFRSVSLPRCMSSHLNYCRHCCRIWTTPTGLTGKVNKLLKMKNSAGESRVIYSLHRLFLLFFPSPPWLLAFLFSYHFYSPPMYHPFASAYVGLCWFPLWFISLFFFYVYFTLYLFPHLFFSPLIFLLAHLCRLCLFPPFLSSSL